MVLLFSQYQALNFKLEPLIARKGLLNFQKVPFNGARVQVIRDSNLRDASEVVIIERNTKKTQKKGWESFDSVLKTCEKGKKLLLYLEN